MQLHYHVKCKKSKMVKIWYIQHDNMNVLSEVGYGNTCQIMSYIKLKN